MADGVKMARDKLKSVELFFSRFVPEPLKGCYFLVARYATFVFGGLIGWIVLFGIYRMLSAFNLWTGISYAAGLGFAIVFTFTYHRYITFDVRTEKVERFTKFAPFQVALAGVNWLLFVVSVEHFRLADGITSFVITFFLSLVNFGVNRVFIFHK